MRAVFSRKEPKIEAKEFCVEKVIMLPAGEYESFTNHLMHKHDFIRENVDFMYEKDGVRHWLSRLLFLILCLPAPSAGCSLLSCASHSLGFLLLICCLLWSFHPNPCISVQCGKHRFQILYRHPAA